jgi:hypothetical protein
MSTEHRCLGYKIQTSEVTDYDCEYRSDFCCDECTFVVRQYTNDKRTGKRPWVKRIGGK